MEFRLLGCVEAHLDGAAIPLGGTRERDLLALLLLTPHQDVSVDRLVEELWLGRPPPGAVATLRVFVSRLRHSLGEHGNRLVLTRPGGYMIAAQPSDIDAVRFEDQVAAVRAVAATASADATSAGLADALALWRGRPFADVVAAPSIRLAATRLDELRLGALEDRIEADLACGRHGALAAELEGLTGEHPLRERLWGSLVLARYRCGRQADALAAVQELRTMLRDELGVEPSASITALERAILQHDGSLDCRPGPVATPPTFADLGRRRPQAWQSRGPLAGRAGPLRELDRLLLRAFDGAGGLALVGGEAGIGKTRIAEEFAALALQRGMATFLGRCYESEGTPSFIPFIEIFEQALAGSADPAEFRGVLGEHCSEVSRILPRLRRLLPDLDAPLELPPELERRYLFNSLREVLAPATLATPTLLVVEDVHWADVPTLHLLEHVTEWLADIPLVVIVTMRETGSVPPGLAALLETVGRRNLLTRIGLERLSLVEVGQVLELLTGAAVPAEVAASVFARTDGNPFFVREIYLGFLERGEMHDSVDIPPSLQLAVSRRLGHLTPPTRRLLECGAVLGRVFSYQRLVAMTGSPAHDEVLAGLDEAMHAGLVAPLSSDPREGRIQFSHDVIRQGVLGSLTLPGRQRLHLRASVVLRDEEDAPSSEIASHLDLAGPAADRGELRRALVAAGREAMAAAAFEEALSHFQRAAAIAAPGKREEDLLVDLALALRSLGRLEESVDTWRRAVTFFEAEGDADRIAYACSEAAQDLVWANRDHEGFEVARRGLAALGEAVTPARARMLATTAAAAAWVAPVDVAFELRREAVQVAEQLGDSRLLGEVLANAAVVPLAVLDVNSVMDGLPTAAALLEAAGDRWNAAQAHGWLLLGLTLQGRFAEIDRLAADVAEDMARIGHGGALFALDWAASTADFARTGHVGRFSAAATSAAETFVGMNFEFAHYARLGMAAFLQGDWDAAVALAEKGTAYEPENRLTGLAWGPLLEFEAYRGRGDRVQEILRTQGHLLPESGKPGAYGSWQFLAHTVEGLYVAGEHEACAALYPVARDLARMGCVMSMFAGRLTERVLAMAAAAGNDWATAEAHFEACLRMADKLPHVVEAAEGRRFLAQMLLKRNRPADRAAAAELLKDAEERYARLGLSRHVELVRELLASPLTMPAQDQPGRK